VPSIETSAKYTLKLSEQLRSLLTNHAKDVKKPGVFLIKYLAGVDQIIPLKRSTLMAQLLQIQQKSPTSLMAFSSSSFI
jgi:hypothetical protein